MILIKLLARHVMNVHGQQRVVLAIQIHVALMVIQETVEYMTVHGIHPTVQEPRVNVAYIISPKPTAQHQVVQWTHPTVQEYQAFVLYMEMRETVK